ncbi:MAG TPA: arylsulfatase [Candidatus Hydrogenedentes bacterium]|nr:arylsulfatase [Candidatus Hydrogenedentota bacterium]HRK33767.1 arylsulfatase [Candidatus Hydrogenedentota bacterium]
MNRRHFIQTAAAMLGVSAMDSMAAAEQQPADAGPNIIFIMADDLGYADLGCYGQKRIQTPSIDRLAAEGMRFTQCYAGAPQCAPSRCVLMTGQHAGHATVRGNHGQNAPRHDGEENRIPLRAEDVTVATLLKRAGYATGITGKWGLGEPGSTGLPNDHGFDEWFGYLNQNHAADYYTDYLWRNKERQIIEGNLEGRRTVYSADLFSDFSLDFIRKNQASPFFLYVATTIPHKNLEVPDLGDYADEAWPDEAKAFAAMVTRMDTHVGQIMSLLKELNLDRKTIVFFTSDNGSAKGWEGTFDSCGPLRDKKFSLYEGGIRCPMIVRWPDRVPAGATSDAVWYFADVLPTVAGLANAKVPVPVDGTDVTAALLGTAKEMPERFLYWEVPQGDSKPLRQAVRWKHWKVVRHGSDGELELFDLRTDIGESHNVAAQHPDVTKRILDFLKTARTPSPHWPASVDGRT